MKALILLATILVVSNSFASDCRQVCDSDGFCSMDCSSNVPTLPKASIPTSPKNIVMCHTNDYTCGIDVTDITPQPNDECWCETDSGGFEVGEVVY